MTLLHLRLAKCPHFCQKCGHFFEGQKFWPSKEYIIVMIGYKKICYEVGKYIYYMMRALQKKIDGKYCRYGVSNETTWTSV